MEYGVKTENKFCIEDFDDEDCKILGPHEILDVIEANKNKYTPPAQQKKTASAGAAGVKVNKVPLTAATKTSRNNIIENEFDRTRAARQDRSNVAPRFRHTNERDQAFPHDQNAPVDPFRTQQVRRDGFGGGFNKQNYDSPNSGDDNKFPRSARGFGGRGRFNNAQGNVGNFRAPRRQFDRQSGSDKTGVKAVDKRDGAGAHNWGSAGEETLLPHDQSAEMTAPAGDMDVSATLPGETPADGEKLETLLENAAQENVELEPVQLTLDEWKAQQMPRNQPQFNVRRPGEGDKNPAWDKLKPLKDTNRDQRKKNRQQVAEDEDFEEIEEDKKIVPINIRFIGEPIRGRGGRGRGGPGRGGFASRQIDSGENFVSKGKPSSGSDEIPYKIDDTTFPSLS